jgi:hypothetical protein
MRPGTILTGGLLPLAFLCACRQESTPRDNDTIPSDFRIVAQFGPGSSDLKPWQCTITGDGKVIKKTGFTGDPAEQTETTLSPKDIKDLAAKIAEADFYELQNNNSLRRVTDDPLLVLTITRNNKTHKVYSPGDLKNDKEMKRFRQIWAELLRKVPSPNAEQKPEDDEP